MKTRHYVTAAGLLLGLALGVGAQGQQLNPPAHPYTRQHLYDETADPNQAIKAGLKQAQAEHKRVILDFGGDWCGDCQVLDIYLHQQPNEELVKKHFVIVHVFIGHQDQHLDIAERYGVPVVNGVPALAVLDRNGHLLYAQKQHDFSRMRYMDSTSVTEFLNKWKG